MTTLNIWPSATPHCTRLPCSRPRKEKMIYTTHEVAKILHSSPNYIYELIEKGKLKAIKLKSFKIRKSAVEEFLKENEGNDLSDIDKQ